MTYVHSVRRIFLSEGDTEERKKWIWVPVYYSASEQRYHRVLPDCLVKFKHHCIKTITKAVNHDTDLDQYSFPSDSSLSRWRKMADDLLRRIAEMKHSASSDPLPKELHDIYCSDCIDSVLSGAVRYTFSTLGLGRLLNLTALLI